MRRAGRYAVNILGDGYAALSDCFAGAEVTPDRDAFCGAAWRPGVTGLPILDAAFAALECTVVETFSAGDHDLFVAHVDALIGDAAEGRRSCTTGAATAGWRTPRARRRPVARSIG